MVENEEITGTMRAEGENDPVSEFIGKKITYKKYSTVIVSHMKIKPQKTR